MFVRERANERASESVRWGCQGQWAIFRMCVRVCTRAGGVRGWQCLGLTSPMTHLREGRSRWSINTSTLRPSWRSRRSPCRYLSCDSTGIVAIKIATRSPCCCRRNAVLSFVLAFAARTIKFCASGVRRMQLIICSMPMHSQISRKHIRWKPSVPCSKAMRIYLRRIQQQNH